MIQSNFNTAPANAVNNVQPKSEGSGKEKPPKGDHKSPGLYKNNTIKWQLGRQNSVVGHVEVTTQLPIDTDLTLFGSNIRLDISSNFYAVPRELEIANETDDTSRSVYAPYIQHAISSGKILQDNDKHKTLTIFSDSTFLVKSLPSQDLNNSFTVTHSVNKPTKGVRDDTGGPEKEEPPFYRNNGMMYWGRLFQIPSFHYTVDDIKVTIVKSSTTLFPSLNMTISHTICLSGPPYSNWTHALQNNYVGLFSNDIAYTLT